MSQDYSKWSWVCALLLTLVSLVGCQNHDEDPVLWKGKQEKAELSHKLELLEYRYAHGTFETFEALGCLENKVQDTEDLLKDLMREHAVLSAEIETIEHQTANLRRDTRRDLRQAAIGRKYDTFSLADGRVLQDATITQISDLGVSMRHEHGASRIHYWDLSPEQRTEFGLDQDSALVAKIKENRETAAYEKLISQRLKDAAEKAQNAAAEKAQIAAAVANQKAQDWNSQLSWISAITNLRPLAQAPQPFGRRTTSAYRYRYGYSRYRPHRTHYRNVYYYPTIHRSSVSQNLSGVCDSTMSRPARISTPTIIPARTKTFCHSP